MTRRRKYSLGAGALLVALALVGWEVWDRQRGEAVQVESEVVRQRDLVQLVTASGEVQPEKSVDVHASVNGTVERVAVREGQQVQEGDFLLQIDPGSAQPIADAQAAEVQAAESEVTARRIELAQARRELERVRQLKLKDLSSGQDLERAEDAVERGRAQLASAEAGVSQARARLRGGRHELSKVTVTAPRSGVITRLEVEEGEFAFSGITTPTLLLTIADLSAMQAEVKVDETDVVDVKLGQPASVSVDAFPDTTFSGVVTEIGTSPLLPQTPQDVVEQAKDFKVVVTLSDSLPVARAGLSATADVETARRPNAVAVPIQALVVREVPTPQIREAPPDTTERGEETEGVFVIRDGRARFVPVEIGITGDRFFEVVRGLQPGARVVSGTYEVLRDLEDGDRVDVIEPEGEKGGWLGFLFGRDRS